MAERYFEKFKTVRYPANTYLGEVSPALNLLSRVTVSRSNKNNPYVYYDYEVKDGQRPDFIAAKYYEDPYGSWLVYLANDIVDPYYGWKMTDEDFENFIVSKYGSIADAVKKTAFYRVNWYEDERNITAAEYETSIPSDLKIFWRAVYDDNDNLLYYERKPLENTTTTNYLVTATMVSNTAFSNGEYVEVYSESQLVNKVGSAEVVVSNASATILKHNRGFSNSSLYIYGTESNNSGQIFSSEISFRNIPANSAVYWSPVSFYDYEYEKNFNKSHIKLVTDALYLQAAKTLKQELA
jgi:hypothetical protein